MQRHVAIRLALDAGMAVSFVLLMAARYTGNNVHEWLGVLLFFLVMVHVRIHAAWWRALLPSLRIRPVRTVVTLFTALFFAGAVVSAVPVSETVFAFWHGHGSLGARGVHMFFAHWALLMAAVHFGMYGSGVSAAVGRALPVFVPSPLCRLLAWGTALYGLWAFISRELVLPILMQTSFTLWHEGDGPVLFFLDYLAVFHAAAWLSYGVMSFFSARAGRRERKSP